MLGSSPVKSEQNNLVLRMGVLIVPDRGLLDIVNEIRRQGLGLETQQIGDITSVEGILEFFRDTISEKVKEIVEDAAGQVALYAINIAAFKVAHMIRLLLTDNNIRDALMSLPSHVQSAVLRAALTNIWRDAIKEYASSIHKHLVGDSRNDENWVVTLLIEKIFEKIGRKM